MTWPPTDSTDARELRELDDDTRQCTADRYGWIEQHDGRVRRCRCPRHRARQTVPR